MTSGNLRITIRRCYHFATCTFDATIANKTAVISPMARQVFALKVMYDIMESLGRQDVAALHSPASTKRACSELLWRARLQQPKGRCGSLLMFPIYYWVISEPDLILRNSWMQRPDGRCCGPFKINETRVYFVKLQYPVIHSARILDASTKRYMQHTLHLWTVRG